MDIERIMSLEDLVPFLHHHIRRNSLLEFAQNLKVENSKRNLFRTICTNTITQHIELNENLRKFIQSTKIKIYESVMHFQCQLDTLEYLVGEEIKSDCEKIYNQILSILYAKYNFPGTATIFGGSENFKLISTFHCSYSSLLQEYLKDTEEVETIFDSKRKSLNLTKESLQSEYVILSTFTSIFRIFTGELYSQTTSLKRRIVNELSDFIGNTLIDLDCILYKKLCSRLDSTTDKIDKFVIYDTLSKTTKLVSLDKVKKKSYLYLFDLRIGVVE